MGAAAEKFRFDLDGGRLSLDFVNTVSGMRETAPREHLESWDDLAFWARQAGHEVGKGTQKDFEKALELREAINDVVVAAVAGKKPPAESLRLLNEWIAEAHAHWKFGPNLEKTFDHHPRALLWRIALDAEELLAKELATGRVRRCDESEVGRCGWLFLDQTRNASRRYCSMTDCGNRAKQRRFQDRKRML